MISKTEIDGKAHWNHRSKDAEMHLGNWTNDPFQTTEISKETCYDEQVCL